MAKALNNLLSATTLASAAEAVLLGERAGLDPEKLVEIINASSGRSASTEVKFPRYVLNRAFDDGFAISLMNKDVGIALDTASELGFPTIMGSVVGQVWRAAVAQGFGGEGHTAIYAFLEELTGDGGKKRVEERAAVATREEKQAYVDGMARERGYVLDFHKVMAEHDFDALQATNNLVEAAYLKERTLDRKTKELIFIVSLTVMRASKGHIASHIRVALDLGLSKEEILEAMEIAIPEAGIVAFQAGFEAWREVTGAEGVEPSVEVFQGGSGSDE